jgi:hypothetical protein
LLAFIRVAIVDLVVGFQAADHAEKSRLADRYESTPGILPTFLYEIGPLLFELGLIGLVVQLAIIRAVSWRTPALVALGLVILTANLDLLPVGAALIGLGLLPLRRVIHSALSDLGAACGCWTCGRPVRSGSRRFA